MKTIVVALVLASGLSACAPSRERVLASFEVTPMVTRPDTVVVRRAPAGSSSARSTEAGMLLAGSRALSGAGFSRFVVVDVGVVRSRPHVWGYILKGFKSPYEAPEAVYAQHDSDVMVLRGLRSYEPSYRGAVDIGVLTRQLADDRLYP